MTDTQALIERYRDTMGLTREGAIRRIQTLCDTATTLTTALTEAEAKLAKARGKFVAIRDAYLDNEGGKVVMKIAVNALAELREG
jgi:hypothetical protein